MSEMHLREPTCPARIGLTRRGLPVAVACVLFAGAALAACSVTPVGAKTTLPTTTRQASKKSVADVAAPTTTTSTPPVGVLVAWSKVASLPIWSSPVASTGASEPSQNLANPNSLGAPLVMLVDKVQTDWVQVYLPQRPNESLGWTLTADVSLVRDPEKIVVSLGQRHLELLRGSTVVYQATVAVGSPQSPTPTGYFYVTEVLKVSGADNPYGPYALGLSGFSNTYTSFEGGPGQIAIHGTNQPWVVGQYASHGCVRLQNADITALATQVQAGTPVEITS